jgi:hypothetical protein
MQRLRDGGLAAFIDRLPAIAKARRLARREVPMFVLEPL